jgi:hypothetical protein
MRPINISLAALCLAASMLTAPAALGQAYVPPRTADGKPDLQGTWTNSSITTLERANASLPLVLDAAQVAAMEERRLQQDVADNSRTNPDEGAPAAGGAIVGVNAFWLDRGMKVGVVNGQPRSSWITEPANGKMPVSDAGRKRIADILKTRSEDGPEGMNPADRCLIGSRGSGGPPMLNNIYNNTYQIVQTPDHVMIDVEMMHDARIIRMNQQHKKEPLKQWLGDSVGRWEGDTLVVETKNWKRLHGDYEPVFLSEQAIVTERFTRSGANELTYAFEVNDPGFYTQPWKGEMVFTPSSGPTYEYACHEGNHALHGILQGARILEEKAGK